MNDIVNSDTREEREISLSQAADDRDTWAVAVNDPVWDRRLRKIGAKVVRERKDAKGNVTMREYELTGGMVRLRKQPTKRVLSDAELQSRRTNIAKAHNSGMPGV